MGSAFGAGIGESAPLAASIDGCLPASMRARQDSDKFGWDDAEIDTNIWSSLDCAEPTSRATDQNSIKNQLGIDPGEKTVVFAFFLIH